MSQVIVTHDNLQVNRDATRLQEGKIDRESQFKPWLKSDITGKDYVESAVGYAVLPIVGLWIALSAAITLMFTILKYAFKGLGKVVGGTRNLITGVTRR